MSSPFNLDRAHVNVYEGKTESESKSTGVKNLTLGPTSDDQGPTVAIIFDLGEGRAALHLTSGDAFNIGLEMAAVARESERRYREGKR